MKFMKEEKLAQIIYEDGNILVVNKPPGVMVHGDGRSEDPTLVDWLEDNYPEIVEVGEPFSKPFHDKRGEIVRRSGIVHRIDKDTSGLLVVAKKQEAYHFLKKQFMDREIEKSYLAIVHGNFKKDSGQITNPIGTSPKNFRLGDASSQAKGTLREALTDYEVVERFASKDHRSDYSLVKVTPKTGRRHQIRIHLKLISHPIVCDKLYAGGKECPSEMGRQALHASGLALNVPGKDRMGFEAPLAEDMANFLDRLRSL